MTNRKMTLTMLAVGLVTMCQAIGRTDESGRIWDVPKTADFDGKLLKVTAQSGMGGAMMAMTPIDLSPYENGEVRIAIKVRGRGVSEPEQPWNGVKVMLKYRDSGTGRFMYPQATIPQGDFSDTYSFNCAFYDVKPIDAVLCLGLEKCSGEVVFDLSSLAVEKRVGELVVNPDYNVMYPDRVARRKPLRGCMVRATVTEQDFSDLAA